VEVTVEHPKGPMPLRYRLSFTETGARFELRDEAVENERKTNPHEAQPYFYYRYQGGRPVLNVREESRLEKGEARFERHLMREDVKPDQSILSQRRDPDSYPELTYLANRFEQMRFYREFHVGRHTPPRLPQKADLEQSQLLEDASNLGLVLNDLLNQPPVKRELLEDLRGFYSSVEDVFTSVSGGTVQIFFHEKDLRHAVPATRLSDGSLRYLCLLAVLCHPDPPPVVCIEEPEIGLHPDVIPDVADLLVEASARSQLLVTTHSDILVDALTNVPEAVVVCEKLDGATQLRRLNAEEIGPWVEKYRLGEIWTQGEIGGNRW
jgi:predicted ATPase